MAYRQLHEHVRDNIIGQLERNAQLATNAIWNFPKYFSEDDVKKYSANAAHSAFQLYPELREQ